jgi:enediyne biosynthesis protein E4
LMINSRGVAVADFWNNGSLDIAVASSGQKHALLKNQIDAKRNWLEVELVGVKTNRDAVGARVSIVSKGQGQMREVVLGDGYGSQNSLRQHFGLGDSTKVDELTVKWPRSGTKQVFRDVTANRIIQITEGEDRILEKTYRKPAR